VQVEDNHPPQRFVRLRVDDFVWSYQYGNSKTCESDRNHQCFKYRH